jgi:putative ABC transport system permease protein
MSLLAKGRAVVMRIAGFFARGSRDRELDQELADHLERVIADNQRAGMAPEEARRQALARFGSLDAIKEGYRDRRGLPWLELTLQDVRYAFRTLRVSPGATLLGILVMALGIGANTAVFSVVYAVLLNPLPYPNADRIVTLTYVMTTAGGAPSRQISIPDFLDWQSQSTSFEAMAYFGTSPTAVVAHDVAEYARLSPVTDGFFRAFAAQPAIGRGFTPDESRQGGAGAAIVSDRYARQQFGDPSRAIGRTLRLLSRSVPIVGVMGPSFDYPVGTDIWFPEEVTTRRATAHRRGNNYLAIARLKPDVTLGQAKTEMTAISERLAQQYPETNHNFRAVVTPLQKEMVGDVQSMLYLLLGAVGLVLLTACATMATLLLAKATSRASEIAVRAALGASRSRIIRQLLVEASVQAALAGIAGVTIAIWGTRALVASAPADVPRLDEVTVNTPVLLFALLLCIVVSVLFGLPPALQASRVDVSQPLRDGGSRTTGGRGNRMREALVVGEIALAVILVATGALLVRSLIALQRTPLGFEPEHVLLMQATTPRPVTADWRDSRAFFRDLLADARQLPGVTAVGAMMGPPGRNLSSSGYWIDRMPAQSPLSSIRPAAMNIVAPNTFAALGVPLRAGREFDDRDGAGRPLVVIVNEALAKSAFGNGDAVGRTLIAAYDSNDPMTIVGVVGDLRQYGPARAPEPEVYMPFQQHYYNGATLYLVVRAVGDPALLGATLERKAHERSADTSVRLTSMDAILAEHVATPKFRAWLLTLFAGVALCLAMTGVYGVMAYVVGQRAKEIGVRMALGASSGGVLWLMLGRGLRLTSLGLIVGLAGAFGATRLIGGMLFAVSANDGLTYVTVMVGLGLLSLLATYVPARRATRIDPMRVLRQG